MAALNYYPKCVVSGYYDFKVQKVITYGMKIGPLEKN